MADKYELTGIIVKTKAFRRESSFDFLKYIESNVLSSSRKFLAVSYCRPSYMNNCGEGVR